MIDPLSVAGLTIAVIDALIKLGERTGDLISDANGFESVSLFLPRYGNPCLPAIRTRMNCEI
jgi:hypothetical protein